MHGGVSRCKGYIMSTSEGCIVSVLGMLWVHCGTRVHYENNRGCIMIVLKYDMGA